MTSEGWTEFGGEDCFSVGCDVVLDLLDRFCRLFDRRWPDPVSRLRCHSHTPILDGVADEFHFFEAPKPGSLQISLGQSCSLPSCRPTHP